MSAYIVDDDCINKFLIWLRANAQAPGLTRLGEHTESKHTRYQLEDRVPGRPRRDAWAELGEKMRELNERAVRARYPNIDPLPGPLELAPYQHRAVMLGRIEQAYKSLQCWLYQCSEGDIDKDPFYLQMSKVHDCLAHKVARQTRAYNDAEWG